MAKPEIARTGLDTPSIRVACLSAFILLFQHRMCDAPVVLASSDSVRALRCLATVDSRHEQPIPQAIGE
jgi:hypothetical protein